MSFPEPITLTKISTYGGSFLGPIVSNYTVTYSVDDENWEDLFDPITGGNVSACTNSHAEF